MRWLAKNTPQVGDRRLVRAFAWVPIRIGYEWVWLESYFAAQEYVFTGSYDCFFKGWVTRERRTLRS